MEQTRTHTIRRVAISLLHYDISGDREAETEVQCVARGLDDHRTTIASQVAVISIVSKSIRVEAKCLSWI